MGTTQVMNHCNHCGGKTMHLAPQTSHILHLILSIVTVGLWIPVWLLVALSRGKPQCSVCGGQRGLFGFGTSGAKPVASGPPSYAPAGSCGACGVGLEGDWARRGICASCQREAQAKEQPVPPLESSDDVVSTIERLVRLRESGALTQEEFEREKGKVLG